MQPREVKIFAQDHRASKGEDQDSNPGPSEAKSTVLSSQPPCLPVISTDGASWVTDPAPCGQECSSSPGRSLAMFKVHLHTQGFLVKQHGMVEGVETNVQQQVNYAHVYAHMHACVYTHTHTHTTYIYTDFLIRVKYHIAKNEPVLYGSHK